MGTTARIMVRISDDRYLYTCLQKDGHRAGDILKHHYNTHERALALIALGELSVLAPSIECPHGHSFSTQVAGYCVAYGRDRGEDKTGPHATFHFRPKKGMMTWYWDGNCWDLM